MGFSRLSVTMSLPISGSSWLAYRFGQRGRSLNASAPRTSQTLLARVVIDPFAAAVYLTRGCRRVRRSAGRSACRTRNIKMPRRQWTRPPGNDASSMIASRRHPQARARAVAATYRACGQGRGARSKAVHQCCGSPQRESESRSHGTESIASGIFTLRRGIPGTELSGAASPGSRLCRQVLQGEQPGDLPIEQPTKFELIINMKTAEALGFSIPQAPPLCADEVIP